MADSEIREKYSFLSSPLTTDLKQPVVLEHDGQPMAVLLSIEAYEHYQALINQKGSVSAQEARRAADRVVFGDLVGCALSSGDPLFVPDPHALWRVPYRSFDGVLLAVVEVDGHTAEVLLTEQERIDLLDKVEALATTTNASS